MVNHPHDIIFEILLRLPAKSLIRFKFVSKSWHSLISGKLFVNAHLNQAIIKSKEIHNQKLMLADFGPTGAYLASSNIRDHSIDIPKELNIPFFYFDDTDAAKCIDVVGSSNGLLCLHAHSETSYKICTIYNKNYTFTNYGFKTRRAFYIFNPTTYEYKELPQLDFVCQNVCLFTGFGYDYFHDDYKVIVGICLDRSDINGTCQVGIFSTNAGSWKTIDSPAHCATQFGYFVNGALNWKGFGLDQSSVLCIVSFHLVEEKFSAIPLPPSPNPSRFKDCRINVLRGCLSLIQREAARFEVWIMKEYGVKESWTALFNFPILQGFYIDTCFSILACSSVTEVLVLLNTKCLAACDPKGKISIFLIDRLLIHHNATLFLESLVSPYCRNEFNKAN